jgi:hypothetical protein
MVSLRPATLMMTLIALAFVAALGVSTKVASADTPEQGAGLVVIHKHCDPADSEGTFDGLIDFEFDPPGLPGATTADADTEFDFPFQLICGDGSSNTDDGDMVELTVGTDLGALVAWFNGLEPNVVSDATITIREVDLPEDVSATYAGCDFDLDDLEAITLGWVCVITNEFEDPDDDDGEDPDGCCGFDLDIDIDNDNTNDIDIDNDNTNNNANNNDNANENANENENENDNKNENTQDQTNEQDQSNTNDQTNNITSSPEVNISGELKKPAPAPKPSGNTGGSQIQPPATGDGGLADEDGAPVAAVLGLGVAALGVAIAGRSRAQQS